VYSALYLAPDIACQAGDAARPAAYFRSVKLATSLVALFLALTLLGAAAAGSRPTVRVADAGVLTLRGAGFRPGEHVRVSVVAGTARAAKRVTASAAGAFRVRFPRLSENACAAFGVTAVGDRGSRASFKRSPGMCPAP
jgi:hypothetical protein